MLNQQHFSRTLLGELCRCLLCLLDRCDFSPALQFIQQRASQGDIVDCKLYTFALGLQLASALPNVARL